MNFALESKLAELTPKKRKQAETLLDLVKKIIEDEKPSYIKKPEDVYELVVADMIPLKKEHFYIFMLNVNGKIIGKETVSIGSLNATFAHPREVYRNAILKDAASIVCVHNHPSGDPTPSERDIEITDQLHYAGEIIGIALTDHIIVGTEGFISLREQGLM
jgi:DNA repair protein RadC